MKNWRTILLVFAVGTLQFLVVCLAAEGAPACQPAEQLGAAIRERVKVSLPKEARLEIGDISALQAVPCHADVLLVGPNPPLGIVSFRASWLEQGSFRTTHGTALVQAYAPVAIAKTPLRPGDPLDETNTDFQERELSPHAQTGFFTSRESLQHVRVRGFARPGMVLGATNVEMPIPVHQGEMVEVISLRGSLRLSAQMRALENGKLDQMIRVQNPRSNRILLARVSGPGELQLR